MRYEHVTLKGLGYKLPAFRVKSSDIESQLKPVYDKLHLPLGQLEQITGIEERRWWPKGYSLVQGACDAAWQLLDSSGVAAQDIDLLIYAGVCRQLFEPATACLVGAELGLRSDAMAYDISNACLGVLSAITDAANRIELGQIDQALVVSCESSREITLETISQLKAQPDMSHFKATLATLTGGSGAAAVLLQRRQAGDSSSPQLLGATLQSAFEHSQLCRWGLKEAGSNLWQQFTQTAAADVLKYGVSLGQKTWQKFLMELNGSASSFDRFVSHQVGRSHREAILQALGISVEKDFPSYRFLGNIGSVSLPLTAALAVEQEVIQPGHRVGFLGIGSGLNCLMMGVQW